MFYLTPFLAVVLTLLAGIVLFEVLRKPPLEAMRLIFIQPLTSMRGLAELLVKGTPLILIAIGLAVGFRGGIWNIGAEGQFAIGALCGGAVALAFYPATGWWLLPLMSLAGIAGGAAWAAIPALLRTRFNANEILVSLMLVYVADMVLSYLVYGPWKDPHGYNFPQTITFLDTTRIPRLFSGLRVNIGLVIALLSVAAFWLFMFRVFAGYQLQVGGLAPAAARYAGFSSRKALWMAMLVSGGMAGLAGAIETAGPLGQLTPHVPAGYGFAAIIVAFVGRLHPVGTVFSAVLMSMFYIGGELAQSRLGLPKSLTGVFQGLLLFSLLACDTLIYYRFRWQAARAQRNERLRPTGVIAPHTTVEGNA